MSASAALDHLNRMHKEAERNTSCAELTRELVSYMSNQTNRTPHTFGQYFPKHNDTYDTRCQKRLVEVLKPLLDKNELSITYNKKIGNGKVTLNTQSNLSNICLQLTIE